MRFRLGVHLGQLAAQPGVDLGELVRQRGDLKGRCLRIGELQDHDRQRPVGGRLVLGVSGGLGHHPGEELVAPGSLGGYGDGRELLLTQLHLDGGVGEEVVVPVGVVRRAEVRADDQQPVAVADMAERGGVRLPGAGAGGGQQQEVGAA